MKVITTTKFVSNDGREFQTRNECLDHEKHEKTVSKLHELLLSAVRTGRPEAVILHLLESHVEVRALLSEYARRRPKIAA